MKIDFIREPELQFATAKHIDIRFGIMSDGPLDIDDPLLRHIPVGIVGTPETVEAMSRWIERCKDEIEAKPSGHPNLFTRFPGFNESTAFRSLVTVDSKFTREIPEREFEALSAHASHDMQVAKAVELFLTELTVLGEKPGAKVILCAPPMEVVHMMEPEQSQGAGTEDEDNEKVADTGSFNFRRLLKARAMGVVAVPIQIVLPMTYDSQKRRRQKRKAERSRQLQDEATRAWNLHTALYYKAGGTPWRLPRDFSQLTACYVGVSFFETEDAESLHTSMAQVFNELGEGLIVRGGPAEISKQDRRPHLTLTGAYSLLTEALRQYRFEHKADPARVVIHKTSQFTPVEIEGFQNAASEHRIELVDLISMDKSFTRLFRNGEYPPLRGTFLRSEPESILYTRGSIDFYQTYPGMYVPRPRSIRAAATDRTVSILAGEILALTKMNWNNTQFDNADPITIKAARTVGEILKYLSPGDKIAARYSHYM